LEEQVQNFLLQLNDNNRVSSVKQDSLIEDMKFKFISELNNSAPTSFKSAYGINSSGDNNANSEALKVFIKKQDESAITQFIAKKTRSTDFKTNTSKVQGYSSANTLNKNFKSIIGEQDRKEDKQNTNII
jgi:hypothetical protein